MQIIAAPYLARLDCDGYPQLCKIIPTNHGNLTATDFAFVLGIAASTARRRLLRHPWTDPRVTDLGLTCPDVVVARVKALKIRDKQKAWAEVVIAATAREARGSMDLDALSDDPRDGRLEKIRVGSMEV